MDVYAFRHFYEYHFAENRKLWDDYVTQLTAEQFVQDVGYSQGSVRDQILHLINVDDVWFSDLRGVALLEPLKATDFLSRVDIRLHWDRVEQMMRAYLADLQDEELSTKPLSGEDKDLMVWQVLLHVVNHGTDHRAQILRLVNDLGIETWSQDYIFYVYEN
jgi:uncharacterized damage-inducible protein DinB